MYEPAYLTLKLDPLGIKLLGIVSVIVAHDIEGIWLLELIVDNVSQDIPPLIEYSK